MHRRGVQRCLLAAVLFGASAPLASELAGDVSSLVLAGGAINMELGSIPDTPLATGEVTVMCGHGERAMTAASLLASSGDSAVSVFDGGPDTWVVATGRDLEIEP